MCIASEFLRQCDAIWGWITVGWLHNAVEHRSRGNLSPYPRPIYKAEFSYLWAGVPVSHAPMCRNARRDRDNTSRRWLHMSQKRLRKRHTAESRKGACCEEDKISARFFIYTHRLPIQLMSTFTKAVFFQSRLAALALSQLCAAHARHIVSTRNCRKCWSYSALLRLLQYRPHPHRALRFSFGG